MHTRQVGQTVRSYRLCSRSSNRLSRCPAGVFGHRDMHPHCAPLHCLADRLVLPLQAAAIGRHQPGVPTSVLQLALHQSLEREKAAAARRRTWRQRPSSSRCAACPVSSAVIAAMLRSAQHRMP